MPIKWSALKVSEAVDEVEAQITLAEAFLTEAKAKTREARKIPNLPGYVDDRLRQLIDRIERIQQAKEAIARVRDVIPGEALAQERERSNQLSLLGD